MANDSPPLEVPPLPAGISSSINLSCEGDRMDSPLHVIAEGLRNKRVDDRKMR